jgi:hypothetical protein
VQSCFQDNKAGAETLKLVRKAADSALSPAELPARAAAGSKFVRVVPVKSSRPPGRSHGHGSWGVNLNGPVFQAHRASAGWAESLSPRWRGRGHRGGAAAASLRPAGAGSA